MGLSAAELWRAYRARLRRRRLLWRSFRSRRQLRLLQDNTPRIAHDAIVLVCVFRNEANRLPYFLRHYRALGVTHFLMVDNGSTDAGADLLRDAQDVSLWQTDASYRASRFGLDWSTWLLMHYGRGRWCLTVDVDELFIYPNHDTRPLRDLTGWLDQSGRRAYGALMLDLFPKGPVQDQPFDPNGSPFEHLCWFDGAGYRQTRQPRLKNLWVQGGARDRVFFAKQPERAPTLNKLPLVKWSRRYAYVNSTHSILPRRLNMMYDGPGGTQPGGILLHTKFLPDIGDRARDEKHRAEHFTKPEAYAPYYDAVISNPNLWTDAAIRYTDWKQFVDLGLIPAGTWANRNQ